MKLQRFEDPELFQEKILSYLTKDEAENNLPPGILNNVISGEYQHENPYMAYVEQDGMPKITCLCTPPFSVIFSYKIPPPSSEILNLVLTDLIDFLGDDFVGISGNKELVARIKELREGMAGRKAEQHMAMRIYKLEEVISPGYRRLYPASRKKR